MRLLPAHELLGDEMGELGGHAEQGGGYSSPTASMIREAAGEGGFGDDEGLAAVDDLACHHTSSSGGSRASMSNASSSSVDAPSAVGTFTASSSSAPSTSLRASVMPLPVPDAGSRLKPTFSSAGSMSSSSITRNSSSSNYLPTPSRRGSSSSAGGGSSSACGGSSSSGRYSAEEVISFVFVYLFHLFLYFCSFVFLEHVV